MEMDENEKMELDGGAGWPRVTWKQVQKALEVIGVMDAIDRFVEGFNSVECK